MERNSPLPLLLLLLLPFAGFAQIQNQDDGLQILRKEYRLPVPAIPSCEGIPIRPNPNQGPLGRSPKPCATLSVVLSPIAKEHKGALRYFSSYQYTQLDCQLPYTRYVYYDPFLMTWIDPFRRKESMQETAVGLLMEGVGTALGQALNHLLLQ